MELLEADGIIVLERSVKLPEEPVTTTTGAATLCAFTIRGFGGGIFVVIVVVAGRVVVKTTIRFEDDIRDTADIELNGRLDALSRLVRCGMGTFVAEH
jgi:capsular polysaccharide biosynthesis protein